MVCLVLPVTKELKGSKGHQVDQELVVMVQVPALKVFQGPQAQRERKVTLAYLAMAPKESQAPQDSLDPPALVDLLALLVVRQGQELVTLDSLGRLVPEDLRVTEDSQGPEGLPVTVPVVEEAPQGTKGYLVLQEPMAALVSLGEKVKLVTLDPPALTVFRDLLVVLVLVAPTAVKEKRGRLTTPTWVWE